MQRCAIGSLFSMELALNAVKLPFFLLKQAKQHKCHCSSGSLLCVCGDTLRQKNNLDKANDFRACFRKIAKSKGSWGLGWHGPRKTHPSCCENVLLCCGVHILFKMLIGHGKVARPKTTHAAITLHDITLHNNKTSFQLISSSPLGESEDMYVCMYVCMHACMYVCRYVGM